MPIFTRMTASVSKAKLKGVSLVPECAIVRIAHNVLDNSSTHKPFASSSIFFKDSKMFLLDDSTWPLLYGWQTEEGFMVIYRLEQNYEILSPFSCAPLSMMIRWGIPNWQIMFSHRNFSTLFWVIVATASASTHFVKYSQATIKNFFCALASGKGSRISSPHRTNGQGATKLESCSGGCWVILLNLWHLSHFRTKSAVFLHCWPIVPLSYCFVRKRSTAHVLATDAFMDFS